MNELLILINTKITKGRIRRSSCLNPWTYNSSMVTVLQVWKGCADLSC